MNSAILDRLQLGLVLLALSGMAWGDLVIRVTQGNDSPTKIAIAPIANTGGALTEDMARIVEDDLKRSGLFALTPREDMLSYPTMVKDVYYRDWRLLGSEYLVVGNMTLMEDGRYAIDFNLLSVTAQKPVFRHRVTGRAEQIRDLSHLISDKVYREITGIPGIFSTRIAYVTATQVAERMTYRLHVADADGAREKLMLESAEPIMSPAWSPDAKELAYVSFETGRPAIFRQNLQTAERRQLTNFVGLNGAPAWSPDGTQLALVLSKEGNPEIYILNLPSMQFTRMTRHFSIDTEPTWMPDGKNLLFTSDRGGTPQIYKLNIATKGTERLTFIGNYNARASVAPDGRTMAMVHREARVFHIASFDLLTGRLSQLTKTRLDESPTVAPNGAMLMYATKQGGRGVLAAVSLDAGVKYMLPARSGDVREPAWSPYVR
jgi:TolB protein